MTTPNKQKTGDDVFGTAEVLKLVIQKLASQSLLFGVAVLVVLLSAWKLSNGSLKLVIPVLFVFVIALAGYLFAEQKNKVEHSDPVTMSRLSDVTAIAVATPMGSPQIPAIFPP